VTSRLRFLRQADGTTTQTIAVHGPWKENLLPKHAAQQHHPRVVVVVVVVVVVTGLHSQEKTIDLQRLLPDEITFLSVVVVILMTSRRCHYWR
jgi:hypothetical protein